MAASSAEYYPFGQYRISPSEVFYTTELSFCFVNISPVLPGHVLVCPKREVNRFAELTDAEVTDLWVTAKRVGAKLEQYHNATSLILNIQDGPQAGQTVAHVHIHVIPRKVGDYERDDDIDDVLDKEKGLKKKVHMDEERKNRPLAEMAREADAYRVLFS